VGNFTAITILLKSIFFLIKFLASFFLFLSTLEKKREKMNREKSSAKKNRLKNLRYLK